MAIDVKKHLYGNPDYFEQVGLDGVPRKKFIYKFGRNPDIGATEELISSGNVYGFPSSAQTVTVTSSNVNDVPAGTGARSVLIMGLDVNYDEIEEIVDLDATSTLEFMRVYRVQVQTTGTSTPVGGNNFGTITVAQSGSGTPMMVIAPSEGQSLSACYTVPNGYEALIWSADVTTGEGKQAKASLKVREMYTDAPFRVNGVRDSFENTVRQSYKIPPCVPPMTDIIFTAISDNPGTAVSATFLLELVKLPD